jgi:hypothetical protein
MDCAHILALTSATLGALGTVQLFRGSWSFKPGPQGYRCSEEQARAAADDYRRMARLQKTGLSSILGSFIIQGVSAIFV